MRPTTKNSKDQKNGMTTFGVIFGLVGICITLMSYRVLFDPSLFFPSRSTSLDLSWLWSDLMLFGALIGLIFSILRFIFSRISLVYAKKKGINNRIATRGFGLAIWGGILAVLYIILYGWMDIEVVNALKNGNFL